MRASAIFAALLLLAAPAAAESGTLTAAHFANSAFGAAKAVRPSKIERDWQPMQPVNLYRAAIFAEWPVEIGGETHMLTTELLYEVRSRDGKNTHEWKDYKNVRIYWQGRATVQCQPDVRECINVTMFPGEIAFSRVLVRDREGKLPDLLLDGVWTVEPHYSGDGIR